MIPSQNRDLNALHQAFRTPFERWLTAVKALHRSVLVVETHRTQERQAYLYGKGRKGVPWAAPDEATVTWTKDSCHEYGLAVDIAPLIGGRLSWAIEDYQALYAAVPPESYGLEMVRNRAGAIVEWPHLQLRGGQSNAGPLGIVAGVPQRSVWPLPAAPEPITPTPGLTPITLVDDAGRDVLLMDKQAIYGGVLISRTADGGIRLDKRGGQ